MENYLLRNLKTTIIREWNLTTKTFNDLLEKDESIQSLKEDEGKMANEFLEVEFDTIPSNLTLKTSLDPENAISGNIVLKFTLTKKESGSVVQHVKQKFDTDFNWDNFILHTTKIVIVTQTDDNTDYAESACETIDEEDVIDISKPAAD